MFLLRKSGCNETYYCVASRSNTIIIMSMYCHVLLSSVRWATRVRVCRRASEILQGPSCSPSTWRKDATWSSGTAVVRTSSPLLSLILLYQHYYYHSGFHNLQYHNISLIMCAYDHVTFDATGQQGCSQKGPQIFLHTGMINTEECKQQVSLCVIL